jgi:hypothetical protein
MAAYNRVLRRVQTSHPQLQFVNAVDVLCTAALCSQRPAGKAILYSDAEHLSPAGARLLVQNSELLKLISRESRMADAR